MFNILFEQENSQTDDVNNINLQVIDDYLSKQKTINDIYYLSSVLNKYSDQFGELNKIIIFIDKIKPFLEYLSYGELQYIYEYLVNKVKHLLKEFTNERSN